MIGRQFRLLLSPSDLSLVQALIETLDAELLSDTLDLDVGQFPPLNDERPNGPDASVFCLIAPRPRLGPIEIARGSDRRPDIVRSYAIEFWRPWNDEGTVRAGRLYYVPSYYDNDHEQKKSDDFLRWASRVFRIVKSHLNYDDEWHAYVGPAAKAMINVGAIHVVS